MSSFSGGSEKRLLLLLLLLGEGCISRDDDRGDDGRDLVHRDVGDCRRSAEAACESSQMSTDPTAQVGHLAPGEVGQNSRGHHPDDAEDDPHGRVEDIKGFEILQEKKRREMNK